MKKKYETPVTQVEERGYELCETAAGLGLISADAEGPAESKKSNFEFEEDLQDEDLWEKWSK